MRIVVLGLGAVGGTLAAALAEAGQDVVGIARGAHHAAIGTYGLSLPSPQGDVRLPLDCVDTPARLHFGPEDAVILATKTQQTPAALEALRAAGLEDQPVFCAQNGVENERLAARLFANVHGIAVMLPADHLRPGEILAYGAPKAGFLDIGRAPRGADAADAALAAAFEGSRVAGFVTEDVMAAKYGKLLLNLGNAVEAALGPGADRQPFLQALQDEAVAVYRAAGIGWQDRGAGDPRRAALMRIAEIPGVTRAGSSSTQSLVRQTGSIESDYLNGEIALIARQAGIAAPRNAALARLAARLAREGKPPGSVDRATLSALLGL